MMPDREKVISDFERWCDEMADECPVICLDALAMLQEQEDMGKELTDAMELIHKKNARIEILNTVLEEQPEIVRCKDCKYSLSNSRFCAYPHKKNNIQPCDWFCADGERKEGGEVE